MDHIVDHSGKRPPFPLSTRAHRIPTLLALLWCLQIGLAFHQPVHGEVPGSDEDHLNLFRNAGITCSAWDPKSGDWLIGVWESGVFRFDPAQGTCTPIPLPDVDGGRRIYALAASNPGVIAMLDWYPAITVFDPESGVVLDTRVPNQAPGPFEESDWPKSIAHYAREEMRVPIRHDTYDCIELPRLRALSLTYVVDQGSFGGHQMWGVGARNWSMWIRGTMNRLLLNVPPSLCVLPGRGFEASGGHAVLYANEFGIGIWQPHRDIPYSPQFFVEHVRPVPADVVISAIARSRDGKRDLVGTSDGRVAIGWSRGQYFDLFHANSPITGIAAGDSQEVWAIASGGLLHWVRTTGPRVEAVASYDRGRGCITRTQSSPGVLRAVQSEDPSW